MISTQTQQRFWKFHVLWPMAVFMVVAGLLEMSSADIWVADLIYHFSGDRWLFRDAWITRTLVHDDGRLFIGMLAIGLLLLVVGSFLHARLAEYRRGLLYLFLSVLASGVLINVLKQATHVPCPWDLMRYGGIEQYAHNFHWLAGSQYQGGCFPAGHASAAWAWIGAYYFAHEYAGHWRFPALLGVFLTGLIFALSQELRGAHFFSHDVWTLGLCWLIASLLYLLFFSRTQVPATA